MKIKKSEIRNVGVFLILLVAFTKSFFGFLYGGNSGVIVVLIIGIIFILLPYLVRMKLPYKITKFSFYWSAVLLVALSNNYDLKNGNIMVAAQLIVGTLLVLILQDNDLWCAPAVRMFKRFVLFHLTAGIMFLFAKGVLIKYIVPLFRLGDSNEYYSSEIIRQINQGYMTGLTSHYSVMGIYMSLGMCAFASALFNDNDKVEKYDLVGVLVMLVATFLTGKRSAMIFPLLAVLIVYFLYFKPKNIKRRYNYIMLMTIVAGGSLLILSLFPGFGGAIGRIVDIMGSTDLNEITNKRFEMLWVPAMLLFLENPVFGIGWGNFKYSFTKYYRYTANQNNAHNVYIQLLCETGVIGTIIILVAMLASLLVIGKTLSKWRKGKITVSNSQLQSLGISMSIQIYFLLYSVSGNPLYDIQCYLPYMIAVAIGLATINKIKTNNKINYGVK